MVVDKLPRSYMVHVPRRLPRTHRALVILFHGSGSNAFEISLVSGMSAVADRYSFVVAYPEAFSGDPTIPAEWAADPDLPVDLDFSGRIIARLTASLCLDSRRIYAAGYDDGGDMVNGLACHRSGTYAAVGTVAGRYRIEAASRCHPARLISVIAFHGTADDVVPYGGTTALLGASAWTRQWARRDRCTLRPRQFYKKRDVTTVSYGGCHARTAVQLYTIHGGGHRWPGSTWRARGDMGSSTRTIHASDLLWRFFAAHPR